MTLDGIRYGPGWDIVETPIRLDILAQAHRRRSRHHSTEHPHHVACDTCMRIWVDTRAKTGKD